MFIPSFAVEPAYLQITDVKSQLHIQKRFAFRAEAVQLQPTHLLPRKHAAVPGQQHLTGSGLLL